MDEQRHATINAGRAAFLICAITTPVAVLCPLTFPFVAVGVVASVALAIRASDWKPSIGALTWAIALGVFEWWYVSYAPTGFG